MSHFRYGAWGGRGGGLGEKGESLVFFPSSFILLLEINRKTKSSVKIFISRKWLLCVPQTKQGFLVQFWEMIFSLWSKHPEFKHNSTSPQGSSILKVKDKVQPLSPPQWFVWVGGLDSYCGQFLNVFIWSPDWCQTEVLQQTINKLLSKCNPELIIDIYLKDHLSLTWENWAKVRSASMGTWPRSSWTQSLRRKRERQLWPGLIRTESQPRSI